MTLFQYVWNQLTWFYNEKVHFLQLHYFYFLVLILFTSCSFYFQPDTHWNYIDALFMATTAATNTGINTIEMSSLTTWQIFTMYFSSFFGSHIMISIIILQVRRHYFSKRFEDILIFNKARRLKEENKRKFKQEVERQRRKTIAAIESPKMLRRLSFMSMRSSTGKDDEDNATILPIPTTTVPTKRKSRFREARSLSTSFTGAFDDLLSHFHNTRENNNLTPPDETQPSFASTTEDIIHPFQANASIPRSSSIVAQDEEESSTSSSTLKNEVAPTAIEDDRRQDISQTRPKSSSNTSLHYPNALHHVNTAESSILSNSSSHHSNQKATAEEEEGGGGGGAGGGQPVGIAFAENIERQRELARKRLQKGRKFNLKTIARGTTEASTLQRQPSTSSIDQQRQQDDESEDDEEMKRIMREPIHKSELTREQRYRLGGAEYRAIVMLTRLVPIYYLFFTIGFGFYFRIYVAASTYAQQILQTSNSTPVNTWFFSFFASISSLNNLGLLQIDANMVPFQSAPAMLIPSMFLILAGNTAYAIFLRVIIWVCCKCTPKSYSITRETFQYLLDHPRRCYTTLFPATQTKWLTIVLLAITLVEFICFVALNFWLPVLAGIDWGARILDGLFQSVATRNAGFSVVNLGDLNPGTQIVYVVAMYISVYPVAISMRNSNVYQERALGIYSGNNDDDSEFEPESITNPYIHRLKRSSTITSFMTTSKNVLRRPDFFVMTQIQRQLTSEICWVIVCIFAICVIESEEILGPSPITIFTVMYECVSAFGNVGASTGYPGVDTSQSAQYHVLSKLVLIILMFRGRHRGLPAAIDRAVLLPSEQLEEKEKQDHLLRRRTSSISVGDDSTDLALFYSRSRTL